MIGAQDPGLYGIPFIPISKLFDISPDKLELLLSINTADAVLSINYDAIYDYLQEQLPDFDIPLLKETLPKCIKQIKKVANGLSSGQEVGLFMHIACSVHRIQNDEKPIKNGNATQIIAKNKRLYNNLRDILNLLEKEFCIQFNDDEIANIIQYIKKC